MIRESDLYLIWEREIAGMEFLRCTDGSVLQLIYPGERNSGSGPDFSNAEISVNGQSWIGNVEIHVNGSEWFRHNHHLDPAYDNVILHVVFYNDRLVPGLQTLALSEYYAETSLQERARKLVNEKEVIFKNKLEAFLNSFQCGTYESLLLQRLLRKSSVIERDLYLQKNDWSSVFYFLLARNFGFVQNAIPFEWLARSTPLTIARKLRDQRDALESLYFGQSGLLDITTSEDTYFTVLSERYKILKHRFGILGINGHSWKFMRMRPSGFPTIRISQFAALLNKDIHLPGDVINAGNTETLFRIFRSEAHGYWNDKYSFIRDSPPLVKVLGKASISNIIINTVVPFIYTYGKKHGSEKFIFKSVELLKSLPPEENKTIKENSPEGMHLQNALQSQAFLEFCLKNDR